MAKKAERGKRKQRRVESNRQQKARVELNNHITCKCSKYLHQKPEIMRIYKRAIDPSIFLKKLQIGKQQSDGKKIPC